MPEQQASPSPSQLPSALGKDHQHQSPQRDDTAPLDTPSAESSKRTYLSLLPPPQLIDLILAIDVNRETLIFPHDLDSAIKALQRTQKQSPPPSPKEQSPTLSVIVKAEFSASPVPPAQEWPRETPPAQPPPIAPPQYKPPVYRVPPARPQHVYPYNHTPYYPPPQPTQPHIHVSPPAPSAPPARHPLFTSAPLTRDPNKPPMARPTPPPVVSSRDDPNAMPSYEEMIVEAIMDVGEVDGTAPKVLFAWMASHYPLQQNFRPSASQALHKALKRGRLEKIGGKYRLNPSWGGGPTTSKRATRRPTANRPISPPMSHPHPPPAPHTAIPPPGYAHPHPPYGYPPYAHHNSLPPHPYGPAYPPNGTAWGTGQPQLVLQPVNGANAPDPTGEAEDEGGFESEDMEVEEAVDERKKEQIKQSLVRLARVLRRFARKGEGTVVQV